MADDDESLSVGGRRGEEGGEPDLATTIVYTPGAGKDTVWAWKQAGNLDLRILISVLREQCPDPSSRSGHDS